MYGIPRILQTREDFDLAVSLARSGEADRHVVANQLHGLLEAAQHYVFDRALAAGEAPDGAMPGYCVVEPSDANPQRQQLKSAIDNEARLFALGFSQAEIESLITELEA